MPWVKGQSGNPKGRPKEAVTMAFKAAKHGREAVVELSAVKVLSGTI
jgi:hypothetical protein